MTTVLIRGGAILRRDGDRQRVVPGDVLVRGNRIESVSDRVSSPDRADRVVDATGQLVMPGLANLHSHSYGNLFRGRFDGLPLEAWVPFATATTLGRTRREGYLSAMLGAVEHLVTGTTVVLDHLGGTLESQIGALEAYRDIGLRVAMAPMVADLPPLETLPLTPEEVAVGGVDGAAPPPAVEQIVEDMRALFADWHRPDAGISILLGPSGPQRCSRALLEACRELAEQFATGVHTHLLESRVQAEAAASSAVGSLVALLDEVGLLTPRFSGAHGVWCSDTELRRLGEVGASLVHNPWSNLTLGSGIARLPEWRRAGVACALGTDGANCGGNLSMFRAMSLAATLSRPTNDPDAWPTPHQVLTMATEGGARAVGLEGSIGRVEAGYLADLALVDLSPPVYLPGDGLVGQVVHGEMGGSVRTVLVDGRVVVEDGRVPGVDVAELAREAEEAVARIESRNAPLFAAARRQEPLLLDVVRRHTR